MAPNDDKTALPVRPPLGMYSVRLDEKGRLKLPVPFQEYLATFAERKLFVTSTDRAQVQLYPISNWYSNLQKIQDANPDVAATSVYLFNAQNLGREAEMDSQGRVTFHTSLRQLLKLDGQDLHFYWKKGHLLFLTQASFEQQLSVAVPNSAHAQNLMEGAGLQ